jgi:filamentous hemagglutinin family protein
MKSILGLTVAGLVLLNSVQNAMAQVVPDTTLPTTVTSLNNLNFTIDGGTRSGGNLFHSFSQFSVPTNGSAVFNNTPDVQNIFSRVTGGVGSNIDGLLQANGSANLFLMNPSGILFGPNARLNLGGSFLGTTASSIKFADGIEFPGTTNSTPLLTMSVPIGLQMGTTPGAIELQNSVLQNSEGTTLALIGGDITQTGGELIVNAGGGRIELMAIGDNSSIGLQAVSGGWMLDASKTQDFRDLKFTQNALVRSKGESSASITAFSRNFTLDQNSRFQSYNEGEAKGGNILINATAAILIQETSDVRTEVDGSGDAGNLNITAPKITLNNGGSIVSVAWTGTGNAGNSFITGKEVSLTNDQSYILANGSDAGSNLVSVTLDRGQGGNITASADTLKFVNHGGFGNIAVGTGNSGTTTLISKVMTVEGNSGGGSVTVGTGAGGDLNIITDSLFMDTSSGYATGSYAEDGGNAGNINVKARTIVAQDDSGFSSDSTGTGRAGSITFQSDSITLDDTQINSRTAGTGNAGSIDVSTKTLRLLNGAQLNVSTKSIGNAGNIVVNADEIEINGEPKNGKLANKNTGIISSILSDINTPNPKTGNGGEIRLNSSSLVIRDGAFISASTAAGQGNGGDINLSIERLSLLNGGQIMNITRNAGDAGSITINAKERIFLSGSDVLHELRQATYIPNQEFSDVEYNLGPFSGIYASTVGTSTGAGGNVKVLGNATMQIQDQARISSSSQGSGNAGSINVNINALKLDHQGSLQAESRSGSQGNIELNLQSDLILRRGSTITTTASETASGGNIFIQSPLILGLENSDIIANAVGGRGGNVNITTQGMIGLEFRNTLTPRTDITNDITASSQFSVNGTVQINDIGVDPNSGLVALPLNIIDPSQKIAAGCTDQKNSSFIVTGRGGIPDNPGHMLSPSDQSWQDLRARKPATSRVVLPGKDSSNASMKVRPLLQATNWQRNVDGSIELLAENPSPRTQSAQVTCANVSKPLSDAEKS